MQLITACRKFWKKTQNFAFVPDARKNFKLIARSE